MSHFLPPGFDRARPVTLIAGKGIYPILTATGIRQAGIPLRLIAFEGETEPTLVNSFAESDRVVIKVGQLGAMLRGIEKFRSGYALMAGQITPKKLFKGLHPDLKAIAILARLKERNAESIFGAIAAEIEKIGVVQLDARAFLDAHLAPAGLLTGAKLDSEDREALAHGIRIAKEVARLDIGQGVVVRRGTVVAVEAFEGTDAMLRRAGSFEAEHLIFVKTVKARQDYRFDVPCFGLTTVQVLSEAGITTAALEAGSTLLLDLPAVTAAAKASGLRIFGYEGKEAELKIKD